MADTVREVSIRFTGQDDTRGVFESIESRLKSLKQTTGRRGLFGDAGELLVGGGALGGITYLANNLASGLSNISSTILEIRNGTKGWGDAMGEIVFAVPVVGGLFKAIGDTIREQVFVPQKILIDSMTEAGKQAESLQKKIESLQEQAAQGAQRYDLIGLEGPERAIKEAEIQRDAAVEKYAKIADEARKLPGGDGAQATIDATRGQIAADAEYERQKTQIIEQELRNRRKLEQDAIKDYEDMHKRWDDEQKHQMDETTKELMAQRKALLDDAGLTEGTFGKPKPAAAGVQLTGTSPFAQAGLLTGQAERAVAVGKGEQQLSEQRKTNTLLDKIEKALRDRRTVQLEAS